jgi:hypothetical protein
MSYPMANLQPRWGGLLLRPEPAWSGLCQAACAGDRDGFEAALRGFLSAKRGVAMALRLAVMSAGHHHACTARAREGHAQ